MIFILNMGVYKNTDRKAWREEESDSDRDRERLRFREGVREGKRIKTTRKHEYLCKN